MSKITQRLGTVNNTNLNTTTHKNPRRKAWVLAAALVAMGIGAGQGQAATTYTWNGGLVGAWDTSDTNWGGSGSVTLWDSINGPNNIASFNTAGAATSLASTLYVDGITFGQTTTVSGGTITLAGPTITATANASISSILAGTAGLTKAGAGTLTLSGPNTYTGATTVSAGTLQAGVDSVAGVSGPFGVNSAVSVNTGTLDINGHQVTIGSLAGGASVILGTNGTLRTGGNNAGTTYSGLMSGGTAGTTSLYKVGTGSMNLNNANNSFAGNIVIDGGRLEFNKDHNLGATPSSPTSNNISIINGGTLYCDNGNDDGGDLGANRGIYLGAGNQTFLSQSGDWHIAGVISGPGGINKQRAGGYSRLYLDAANTFTGDTYFNGNGSKAAYGGVNISNPLALQYSALDTTSSGSNFGAPANLICGGLIGNGAFGTGGITGSTLTSITMQPQIVGLTKTYSGVLSGAAGMTVTLNGPGTQALNGLNTYTGATTIKNGVLVINTINNVGGGNSSLGNPSTVPNGTIAIGNGATGAELSYTGTGSTTDRVINMAGTTGGVTLDQSGASGILTLNGNITATGVGAKTLTLQGSTAGSGVLGGAIVDSSLGATSLTKTGTGMWTLNGANTHTGDTTLNGGTLRIGNNLALQNSALNYQSGTLAVSGISTPTFGGLTGSTALTLPAGITTLTLSPAVGVTKTYSGALGSDTEAMTQLIKSGLGTQVLSGANLYTGTTAVSQGKLYLNNTNATTAISVAGLATLGGSGSASSATATVADTGIVEAGFGGAGTLTLNGLTFSNTGTARISGIGNYGTNAAINAGTLAVDGGAGSVVIALSGTAPASGTAHLIQYTGAIGGTGAGFGAFTLNTAGLSAGPRTVFTLANPTGFVDVTYSLDHPVWKGAGSGNWITENLTPVNSPANWMLASNPAIETNFILNDAVVFNDSVGSGTTTVNISAGDVAPSAVTFDNSTAKHYTLESTGAFGITGGAALNKSNTGTLTITNNNSYTGGTNITGGTVVVGNGGTSGNLGSGAILNDGSLVFNRSDLLAEANPISGTGSVSQSGTGELVLSGANSHGGGTTLSSGTLTLGSATAPGTGTLTINSGTLDSSVVGLALTNNNAQVWNGDFAFKGTNDLNLGTGAVSLGSTAGARTVTVTAGTLTVGGAISDGTATSLVKAGAGTLVLGGASNYSGGTTVNAGTLTVNDGATLGASGPLAVNNPNSTGTGTNVVLNLDGSVTTGSLSGTIATPVSGTNTATINIVSGKTLTVNQTSDGQYDGLIAGAGALTKDGTGKLTLTGLNTYSGGTTLSDGVLSISSFSDTLPSNLGFGPNGVNFGGGTLQYTGHAPVTTTQINLKGGNQTFDITQSDADFTINGNYTASTITKLGAGTLTFGGHVAWYTNNYGNGALEVDNGTLVLNAQVDQPTFHAAYTTVNDVKSGATLKLGTTYNNIQLDISNTFHMSGGTYDINGVTNNGSAQIDGSGTITNNGTGAATVNVFANLNNTFSGNIVDGSSQTGLSLGNVGGFGGNGAAVWTLSGNNTYSGATTVGVGTLAAGSTTGFSPKSTYTIANGATLELAGFNNQIAGLDAPAAGTGKVQSTGGAAILTVNNDIVNGNADNSFGGVLQDGASGTLGLIKTGSKMLTLTGHNNTYIGGTIVDGGTLAAANANGSATGTGPVTLNGGILAGSVTGGTITGPVVAGSGSHTIAPGAGLAAGTFGKLTLSGGLTTSHLTTLAFNLGTSVNSGTPTGDTLLVDNTTSTFGSGTNIAVSYNPATTFTVGDYFHLIQNYPSTAVSFPTGILSNFNFSYTPALPPTQQFILSTTEEAGWIDLVVALTATNWTGLNGNNWTDSGNWNSAIPAAGQTATFSDPTLGTGATADLGNTNGTMGQLIFNSNHGSVTIQSGGTGKLVLDNGSLTATMNVTGSGHSITAPVTLASAATVITVNPASDLAISGDINGGSSLSKEGPGTLTIGGTNTNFTGSTTINKGTLITKNLYALGNPSNATLPPFTAANVTVGPNGTLHVDVPGIHLASLTVNGLVTTTDLLNHPATTGNIELGTVDSSGNTVVPGTLNLGGPDIYNPAGLIDLQDRMLIIHYTQDSLAPGLRDGPAEMIKAALVSGRNVAPGGVFDGPWTGTAGITSSRAAKDFSDAHIATGSPNTEFYALGYGDTGKQTLGDGTITNKMLINDAGPNFFDPAANGGRGAGVGSTVFVRYTRVGDATMDGIVGNNDVTVLGLNFDPTYDPATNPNGPKQWYDGDFNYNGIVDNNDVTILGLQFDPTNTSAVLYSSLVSQYGASFASSFAQGYAMSHPTASVVPEPAALTLLGVGALALIRRRRQV